MRKSPFRMSEQAFPHAHTCFSAARKSLFHASKKWHFRQHFTQHTDIQHIVFTSQNSRIPRHFLYRLHTSDSQRLYVGIILTLHAHFLTILQSETIRCETLSLVKHSHDVPQLKKTTIKKITAHADIQYMDCYCIRFMLLTDKTAVTSHRTRL